MPGRAPLLIMSFHTGDLLRPMKHTWCRELIATLYDRCHNAVDPSQVGVTLCTVQWDLASLTRASCDIESGEPVMRIKQGKPPKKKSKTKKINQKKSLTGFSDI